MAVSLPSLYAILDPEQIRQRAVEDVLSELLRAAAADGSTWTRIAKRCAP